VLDGHQGIVVREDGLLERRARDRFVPGLAEVVRGCLPLLRPEGMMTQAVNVLDEPIGVEALDGREDLAVETATPVLEQAPVGHLVRERMLERVLEIREEACLVQELGGLEAAGQAASSRVPHSWQKTASPGFSCWHPGHIMAVGARLRPDRSRPFRQAERAA
jgi:hypothetical protein